MTLTVSPAICLLKSQPVIGQAGLRSTACEWNDIPGKGVGPVTFTLLGLEPGEHTLTFTLKTPNRRADIVEKKLRVVVRTDGLSQEYENEQKHKC